MSGGFSIAKPDAPNLDLILSFILLFDKAT